MPIYSLICESEQINIHVTTIYGLQTYIETKMWHNWESSGDSVCMMSCL